jgi:uncharacterized protein YjbI with pentapeptide repeats
MESRIIGSKIAEGRKKMNISQAGLAKSLFISPQAVGKWERGESMPDITTFDRLAEILGVDLNYFSGSIQSVTSETQPLEILGKEFTEEVTRQSGSEERQLLTNFSGTNLPKSDFAGVTAHKRKFDGSALSGSDFLGADLTGSSFVSCEMREVNFDGSNLTDCTFSIVDLTGASFNKTILVRTELNKLGLSGAKFTEVKLTDVKLKMTDLRETIFANCIFNGVDFIYGDLRGLCLDGQTFIDVKFDKAALDKATFKSSTLKNVSFRPTNALTNKYYRAIKTICFNGAIMDKLTYAALNGFEADLSKVTVI